MGVTGCYLVLFIIYKIMPYFKSTSLEYRAIERGRYTLDIYLLNIIILEMICGPLYRNFITIIGYNLLHSHGFVFELITTLIGERIMMEIIVSIDKIMNKNVILQSFSYRDIKIY